MLLYLHLCLYIDILINGKERLMAVHIIVANHLAANLAFVCIFVQLYLSLYFHLINVVNGKERLMAVHIVAANHLAANLEGNCLMGRFCSDRGEILPTKNE